MISAVKKIFQNKNHRSIAVLCILCVTVVGIFAWFLPMKSVTVLEANDPDVFVDFDEPQVPLRDTPNKLTMGDIVVINIIADEMDDVYGYQFEIDYDREYLEYNKHLYSDIDEILTIFATDREQYLLVGATMIGDVNGYDGQAVPVCRMEFLVLADFEFNTDLFSNYISLSNVNVVTSDLQYMENIDGWTASINA